MDLFLIFSILFFPTSYALTANCTGTTLPASLDSASLLTFTDLRVTCAPNKIEARVKDCPVQVLGHNATDTLAIANSNDATVLFSTVTEGCKPVLGASTVYAGLDAIFTFNISECNPIKTINSTHQIYEYAVRSYLNPTVANYGRAFDISFSFSCIYVLNIRVSLGLGAGAQVKTSRTVAVSSLNAELDVAMGLFSDAGFSNTIDTNLTLTVPTAIYVGVTLTDAGATYLVLQAEICWATPTIDPYDASQYPILDAGCPYAGASNPSAIELFENYYSSQSRFSFQSFLWAGLPLASQVIYVHCRVSVCDTVLSNTCKTKSCVGTSELSGRKKKSVPKGLSPHVISLGPIAIDGSRTPCSISNGGCSQLCSVDIYGRRSCSCRIGYSIADDGSSCELVLADEDRKISKESMNAVDPFPAEILILILAVILLLLSVAGFCIMPRRWKRRSRFRANPRQP